MIEHFKICKNTLETQEFSCPKCPPDKTKYNLEELRDHLENDCYYMEVICLRCHSLPVQRRNFVSLDHKQEYCLNNLKTKVRERGKIIKCRTEEISDMRSYSRLRHRFGIPDMYDIERLGEEIGLRRT